MMVVRYVDVGSWTNPDDVYFQRPPGDPPMVSCQRYRVTVEIPDFIVPGVTGDATTVSVERTK